MSVSINGTNGLVFNDASTQATAASGFGFKNRIINGAMMIDQRNAGASVTLNDGVFPVDRFRGNANISNKCSAQQSSVAPVGFTNSMLITSTSAYSVGAGEIMSFYQAIEGLNCSDLGWGTANAQTVTLSFWVRSSLTGTFGGALKNSASNRSYPFTYTISSANTWEQKSITIAGDTSGTWLTTNGVGIFLQFGIGVGSTFSGTAGAWAGANYASATGATSVVGTNGATFYITGVQLEKGSTATSFDYRPYGTELQLCQRYYDFLTGGIGGGNQTSTTNCGFSLSFRVPKRAAPTPSLVGTVNANDGTAQVNISSLPSYFYGDTNGILINFTTASLTANRPTLIYSTGSSAGLALSAEL